MSVFFEIKGVIRTGDGSFQIAKDGIHPGETLHINAFTIFADDFTLLLRNPIYLDTESGPNWTPERENSHLPDGGSLVSSSYQQAVEKLTGSWPIPSRDDFLLFDNLCFADSEQFQASYGATTRGFSWRDALDDSFAAMAPKSG